MRLTERKNLNYLKEHIGNENFLPSDNDLRYVKLGQLEDILEKYGIDDLGTLDELISVHKFLLDHNYKTMTEEDFDALFTELKKYKDIEEELGIDLITLVKSIKDGIYIKNDKDEIVDVSNEPCVLNSYVPTGDWGFEIWGQCPINFRETFTDIFRFKDYGKTWALTKEELTDGK